MTQLSTRAEPPIPIGVAPLLLGHRRVDDLLSGPDPEEEGSSQRIDAEARPPRRRTG